MTQSGRGREAERGAARGEAADSRQQQEAVFFLRGHHSTPPRTMKVRATPPGPSGSARAGAAPLRARRWQEGGRGAIGAR